MSPVLSHSPGKLCSTDLRVLRRELEYPVKVVGFKTFSVDVRVVCFRCSTPGCARVATRQGGLTALVVDDALLRLLGVELAQRAVLGVLLDVPLPGPRAHPAGGAAGRPADPLGHHARGRLCRHNGELRYVTGGM